MVMLEDAAVTLRPLVVGDADEWLAGEDDEQIRWFEFPCGATREDVVNAIARWQDSWRTGGPVRHWGVWVRATGELAGGVELRDLGNREVNLSYLTFPAHRRAGRATRAARLALAYAAAQLGAVSASIKILQGNAASVGVAERLGAVLTGTAPSDAGNTFVVYRLTLVHR